MTRTNPGVYHEMKERMRVEVDPFTLFSVGCDDTTPPDVRRVCVNRIGDLHRSIIDAFIMSVEDAEFLAKIGRSRIFPAVWADFAKARAKVLRGEAEAPRKPAAHHVD